MVQSVRPKIVCMMRIKNEEKWIARALAQNSRVADAIIILDDGSTDRTPEICQSSPGVVKYQWQNNPVTDEARDKNLLLQWALELKPDWLLAMDGDEIFEDVGPEAIKEAVELCPAAVSQFAFEFLYLWDSESQYRWDGLYRARYFNRMLRLKGQDWAKFRFSNTSHGANFHCGSLPQPVSGEMMCLDVKVKHYGYFFAEQRKRKYHWYNIKDPDHAGLGYYEHLVSQRGMVLMPYQERENTRVRFQFGRLHLHYGLQFHRLGKLEKALEEFKKALEISPEMPRLNDIINNVEQQIKLTGGDKNE